MKSSPPRVHGSALPDRAAGLAGGSNSQLPTRSYQVISSRDGNSYEGLIVGSDPSTRGPNASVSVRTQVVPIILKFHSVATAINLKTGIFTTASGNVIRGSGCPPQTRFIWRVPLKRGPTFS